MTTYDERLRGALLAQLGAEWLRFMPGWKVPQRGPWRGAEAVPVACVLHHTAAAKTSSTNPKAPGNQTGANDNVIDFIAHHYPVPAANFALDRDGTVVIFSAYPVWHAGLGSFVGRKPWNTLGVPNDAGNDYMLGCEIMSLGASRDFTVAQQTNLVFLLRACRDASGWNDISLRRRPQHKDWAPNRKVDLRYTNAEISSMILKYGFHH